MGEIIEATRNIFIDTEQYHTQKDLVNILLPNNDFSVTKNQSIRITLEQFECQKKFYNINKNNNKFYAFNTATSVYTEIVIPEGDYFNFGTTAAIANSLCSAIRVALLTASITGNHSVSYNVNARKLIIDMSGAGGKWDAATSEFRTFQIPPSRTGTIPDGISASGYYSDSYELLGAKPNKYSTDAVAAFSKNGDNFTSFYPASLFTIESLHLAVDIQTQNYQTPSLDVDSAASRCIPTQIFARIPIDMGNLLNTQHDQPSLITFTDTGAKVFSINLQNKHVDNLRFKLLDGKGREISEVSAGQYYNGALSYKMVLRWEALQNLEKGIALLDKKDNTIPDFYQQNKFLGKL